MVECLPSKQGVVGSSPISRSNQSTKCSTVFGHRRRSRSGTWFAISVGMERSCTTGRQPGIIRAPESAVGGARVRGNKRVARKLHMPGGAQWYGCVLGRSYMFQVKDEDVAYEVEFKAGLFGAHYTIRRNGVAIFAS